MDVLEIRGKSTRGIRKVYVLLTDDMVNGIEYLLKTRHFKSTYIFGR